MKNRHISALLAAALAASIVLAGCGGNSKQESAESTTAELSTSDLESVLESSEEGEKSIKVEAVEVAENSDGSVTVTVKAEDGTSETISYENKEAFEAAAQEDAVPKAGDVVTVTTAAGETKVEVTRDGKVVSGGAGVPESTKEVAEESASSVVAEGSKEAESTSETATKESESAKASASEAPTTTRAAEATPTQPAAQPTAAPTQPAAQPTAAPTQPATQPTAAPTQPAAQPTAAPTQPTAAPTQAPTEHVHTWVEVAEIVHHDAVPEQGHTEQVTVVIEEAWDEKIKEQHTFCNTCGMDLTAAGCVTDSDVVAHMIAEDHDGWHTEHVVVQVIHHDPVTKTEDKWIVDVPAAPAYDEVVVTGYRCSGCGATK